MLNRCNLSYRASAGILRNKIYIAVCSILLLDAGLLFGQASPITAHAGIRDFVEYWAASRLFWYGGNPYSPAELMTLQQTAGWNGAAPLIMWNPPWSLLFTLPFGLVEYATSQFLWLLVHVILILYSTQQLWRIYGDSARSSRLPWILALTFVPTLFVLIIGQITPLVLAGLTLLLYAERKQSLWTTSASLLILSIKPQVLYLFWIVFALWLLEKRPWRVVWRAALVGVAAGLVPVLFDPNIYSQYLALYGVPTVLKPMDWPVPTLRNVIRVFFDIDQMWLQLAPTILAILWAVYYWQRHKHQWVWLKQLPLLLLVSVATSFFVWTYDQVVLLPAIIEGATWIKQGSVPWYRTWSARIYVAINSLHLLQRFWLAEELWYFWLAPALLLNYLLFLWEKQTIGRPIGDPRELA